MGVFWISILSSGVLGVSLAWAAHQLLVTARVYRRVPMADAARMLRYTLRTRNAWVVLLPVLTVIMFCFVLPSRGVSYPKIILWPIVLLHINVLLLYGTPPSVLLLGSSRWETVRLFNLVERGIYPYRTVFLLDPSQSERARHSRHHWMHFEVDNLRVLGPNGWREVVQRIAEVVPVIVHDARLPSPAVVEEAGRMAQEPFRQRTLFVVADDGDAPALAAAGIRVRSSQIRTARLEEVVTTLKKMGLTETTSPDDVPAMAQASFTRHSKAFERGMVAVARAGMPFVAAIDAAERAQGAGPFLIAARGLQERLLGEPGDGALEVFAQLSDDIAETERFINKWRRVDGDGINDVLASATVLHRELCQLQEALDHAPPSFLQKNEEILRHQRGE